MRNLLAFVFILTGFWASSQVSCFALATPEDTVICPGDSVNVSIYASITSTGQSFDFNSGALPGGWNTVGGTNFGSPCGPGNGTDYYWASTAGTTTPSVSTAEFDVSCGGNVVFDMVYSIQGDPAPCEGPDEEDEGVELQYSTDGGLTWITIVYYSPGGFELPTNPGTSGSIATGPTPYTDWTQFSVPIPSAALSTSTMFRWIQVNSSGADFDNWGLDNISVQAGPCESAVVDWSNGLSDTTSFWITPSSDTTLVALVYDTLGVLQCSDTVNIFLNSSSFSYDLIDTVFSDCPTDTTTVSIVNITGVIDPITYSWSNGSIADTSALTSNGIPHDTIPYYVTIVDGCGFTYDDSVILIVNQLLQIDTTLSLPSSACLPDGTVSAIVSGVTGTPLNEWTGPGANSTNFYQATVWQGVSAGWYYFEVQDDVCVAYDSVFVEPIDPPIANIAGSPTAGCGPLVVTFTNSSENTTNYTYDFGNGDPILNVNTMDNQTASYIQTTTMMFIASDDNGCSDTAYVSITVDPCGCTDPIAENYNPNAIIDDGNCIYPTPIVNSPNIFTPNNDGENDLFYLTTENTAELELIITNRWGNVMLNSTGISPVWNGETEGGAPAAEGVYFYRYKAIGFNGDEVEGHGFLHLVRD